MVGTNTLSLGGKAAIEQWQINDIMLSIATIDNGAFQFKGKIAGFTTPTIQVRGTIDAAIDSNRIELGGNVVLDNGIIELNPSGFISSEETKEVSSPLLLNLSLSFGKNVRLYLPSRDLPLLRGTLLPNSSINVNYDQSNGALSVNGKVDIQSGYVLYLLRDFS